jgi:class 3 adenylate cyclase/tetratricopeptide (TPR) repeat protein
LTCSNCGSPNEAGARFCAECGTALAGACRACGAALAPAAKFCSQCGTRAGEDAAPHGPVVPAAPASGVGLGAERRVVSVLFADLVGFTTLAEGRDAELVRDLLTRYFETSREVIRRYGGIVEKFIGDAVMAVWGAPVAHEDDAERAVRAALDLVASVAAVGREEGVELVARAGVLTGEAAVTLGAVDQGLVAGDLVNTAARLQSVALPGTVLVGEATRAAAEEAIAFEPVGETSLKGKASPVPAFRALRVVGRVRGGGRTDSLEPPFVGRDTEFRVLRDAYHAVARDRRARLVSISGDAGIGKSRLAWEFNKYSDGITEQMWWHEGRSPSYGEGVSFWALSEMVRKRAGLVENDDEATTRERVAATLAEHVPDTEERAFIEPCLLALLGLGEPPPGGRERLFAGWRMFFERLAATDPVVLVFEDVQWADDGLLDFIESLLQWSGSYPILVVSLARPELFERRPAWASARNATTLPLAPLADDAMRALLDGLVPGLPAAATRSILARAGGIPLYAVEMIRMLIGTGALEPSGDGTYQASQPLESIDIPASLRSLVAARLDALPGTDRALLQDAAVLGQTFPVDALAALTGDAPTALESRLRALIGRDLLVLDTDPRSPERGQYGFVQAVIREVAYDTLAKRDRRVRHLAAARYFEALGDDELSGALATHYQAAYRAAAEGPEADALAVQARIALRAAGERAASLGSPIQAITYLTSAADLPGPEIERLELLQRAGTIASEAGRHEQAVALIQRAIDGWKAVGDRTRTARAGAAAAAAALWLGQQRVRAILDTALADFGEADPTDRGWLELRAVEARSLLRHTQPRPAAAILEEILPSIEALGDLRFALNCYETYAHAIHETGQSIHSLLLHEGVLRHARILEDTALIERVRVNLGVLLMEDDPIASAAVGNEALDELVRRGSLSTAAFFAGNTSETEMKIGDWGRIRDRHARLMELGPEGLDREIIAGAPMLLDVLQGTVEPAERASHAGMTYEPQLQMLEALVAGDGRAAAAKAIELGDEDSLNAAPSYLIAAMGAGMARDAGLARDAATKSVALGRHGRWVENTTRGTVAVAEVLDGRRDAGVELGRAAIDGLSAVGARFDAACVAFALARAVPDDDPERVWFAETARAVFRDTATALLPFLDDVPPAMRASPTPAEARTRSLEAS